MRSFRRVAAGGAGIAAAALLAAGCGYGGTVNSGGVPDTTNGASLFQSTCGACHTLAAAGTSGTIGPNLDNAFAGVRAQGYPESAISNVVLDQIRLGSGPILKPYTTTHWLATHCVGPNAETKCLQTSMPANLLTGQDAKDVAAYVGSVAGAGGFATNVSFASLGTNGAAIFKGAGCSGCHTLAAAGATGTVGPNLDQLMPTEAAVVKQVTNGGGLMPAFAGTGPKNLSTAQIEAVAKYVSSVAGKK